MLSLVNIGNIYYNDFVERRRSMEPSFQRAKSQENKNIRLQQIMNITDQLFHQKTYHEITLSVISKELKLARGGLYKYVSSKEEIFLLIYLQKEKAFIDDLCLELQDQPLTIDSLSSTIAAVFYKHLDFIKYHQILNAIIETNVSIEKLAEFKKENNIIIKQLHDAVNTLLNIDEKAFFNSYLTIVYHCVYLYDRVAYADTYVKAMEIAGLCIDDIDFIDELTKFVKLIFTNP